ncbi:MAG: B12-binding domain-containing radical SAM protein, partial [Nitrospinota bacterium]
GCYALSVGMESGSPRILRLVKKQLTKELIRSRVEMIARAGIEVCGFFILGFPGETREEIEDTIRFALELPLIRATFSNYQPFPGTEDFCRLVECGDVEEDIWQRSGSPSMILPTRPRAWASAICGELVRGLCFVSTCAPGSSGRWQRASARPPISRPSLPVPFAG